MRQQADILAQHLSGEEIDIDFVRIHALILYQCVAERSEVFQLLKSKPGVVHALIETEIETEAESDSAPVSETL